MPDAADKSARLASADLHREVLTFKWYRYLHYPGPWIILAVSFTISLFAGYLTQQEVAEDHQARFTRQVDALVTAIDSRLVAYTSVLRGGVGLFNASREVDRDEWRAYTAGLQLQKVYPGIQGLGFAEYISPQDLDRFERRVRDEGFPDFKVHPQGPRDLYTSILFLEPFDWRNRRAFGYDMYSNPVRREAMARARDEAAPSISGKVTLLQETRTDRQAGFLLYLPQYRKGMPTATQAQRRAAIQGFVYSPFRMDDLMAGILGEDLPHIRFRIHDRGGGDGLMYDSDPNGRQLHEALFRTDRHIDFGGRRWDLSVASTPAFEAANSNFTSLFVLLVGALDSFLLFVTSIAFLASRDKAANAARALIEKHNAQERYRVLMDTMPTAFLAVDGRGRIVQANQQAVELFGYARDDLLQLKVEQLIPDQYRATHARLRESYQAAPSQRAMGVGADLFAATRTGEAIPVEIGLSPLQTDEGRWTLATVVDVRERVSAQQELASLMDRLQRKNREMEKFIYTVSHDLKAPLVTIHGFSSKLMQRLDDRLGDDERRLFGRIQTNVHVMERLLDDLLQLSRVVQRPIVKEPLDTVAVVAEALETLAVTIQQSGAEIEVDAGLPRLHAQRGLLHECLQNLLSNAIKYHREGEVPRIRVSGRLRDGGAELNLQDNGVGIEARHRERIFELFEQLGDGKVEGSGVGLAIVKTIMDRHGGRVTVESVPGQGSCFTLFFPATAADDAEAA